MVTFLKSGAFALVLLLTLGSVAFAEDKVFEFNKDAGGMTVQIRCTDRLNSEDIGGVIKIVLGTDYIHIETKDGMFWYPRESVQKIRWFKATNTKSGSSEKPPVKSSEKKAPAKEKEGKLALKKFPDTPRGALKECISLLKQKKYAEFVKGYLHPDDYKKMEKEIGLKVLIEGFQGAKADGLLLVLEELAEVNKVDEVAGVATFKNKAGASFAFYKSGERWYIKN